MWLAPCASAGAAASAAAKGAGGSISNRKENNNIVQSVKTQFAAAAYPPNWRTMEVTALKSAHGLSYFPPQFSVQAV